MVILESFTSLILLLAFFGILGLGVTNLKTAKNNFVLLPIFGYATLITLSYFISANFKISGASAVGWTILILLSSFLVRIKSFSTFLQEIYKNGQGHMFLAVAAIPICTLILPALLIGFKYFFGYVNFDFFYNSQDSWYLMTHDVLQFSSGIGATANMQIIPLNWSASLAGRIGVGILGAFFSKTMNFDVLHFNSLLLNTIVIMFALSMSVLCREFFKLSNKAILIAVLFSVMSASYVQAYCYYVLGQISVIPVFIIYCIYLKRFIDNVIAKDNVQKIYIHIIILGLLLNALIVMYAIIAFFALCLTSLSFMFVLRREFSKRSLLLFIKWGVVFAILFCVLRILIAVQSINILRSWISLSTYVAAGTNASFSIFSEYVTGTFLALILGLCNYPSSASVFHLFSLKIRGVFLFLAGFFALITIFYITRYFIKDKNITKGAKEIVLSLFLLFVGLTGYFFYTDSGYGMFKLQSWFIPLILPIYIYFLSIPTKNKVQKVIKVGCVCILFLNICASLIYLSDFLLPSVKRHFISLRGITANKDIQDLATKLNNNHDSTVSLFLNNGIEAAWIAEYLRAKSFDKVAHNFQPLLDKNHDINTCEKNENVNWAPSGLVVVANPSSITSSDIVDSPTTKTILYQNSSYTVLDATQLTSLMFTGAGSYPINYSRHNNNELPSKYRVIENGLSVLIYSKTNNVGNFVVEVALPKENHEARNIVIKIHAKEYFFIVKSQVLLTIFNVMLHKGLNCITIESHNDILLPIRSNSLMRGDIPTDFDRRSFLVSRVLFK